MTKSANKITTAAKGEALENEFLAFIRTRGIPDPERQFRFHPVRRWRFDFAWPDRKFAVEVDGVFGPGGSLTSGHRTVKGFLSDAEKYEAALLEGWRVYKVPSIWIRKNSRRIWRGEVIQVLHKYLSLSPS